MKNIPLANSQAVTLIDEEDYPVLSEKTWLIASNGYVYRNGTKEEGYGKHYIHREIMNPGNGLVVDHINHDKLNNTKTNLRVITYAQNNQNGLSKKGRSRYKGVYWSKVAGKWAAQISENYKGIPLGYYHKEEEAAIAYNKAAIERFGEFAHLNEIS